MKDHSTQSVPMHSGLARDVPNYCMVLQPDLSEEWQNTSTFLKWTRRQTIKIHQKPHSSINHFLWALKETLPAFINL